MIVISGAAGFIGMCLIKRMLLEVSDADLILVDDFLNPEKEDRIRFAEKSLKIDRDGFLAWFEIHHYKVDFIFHMGARTDTAEQDRHLFNRLNLDYSKSIWKICTARSIGLIYASSAATYGDGSMGFKDSTDPRALLPLNPYGESKNDFDKWVLKQTEQPPLWVGLKFFNVYGPNEYHKGRMASVIFHTFNQIKASGKMNLFKSHRPDFGDGQQQRDFIYAWDVADTMISIWQKGIKRNGIYNLGTGKARTFEDLVTSVFISLNLTPNIQYIDIPKDIRDSYQYFTEANMESWTDSGIAPTFRTLEEGIKDYVENYLLKDL